MMRMLSLVSLMVVTATVFSLSAKGDEPLTPKNQAQSQDVKLPPELQSTVAQLLKTLGSEQKGGGTGDANPMGPLISQMLKMLNSSSQGGGNPNVDMNKVTAIVSQMLKMLDIDATDPSGSSSNSNSDPSGSSTRKSREIGLHTHSLDGSHMTNDQWRELFPNRH